MSTPFKFQKHNEATTGRQKKRKSDKQSQVDPLALTKGDLDEIGDKVCDTTSELWSHFE